MPRNPVTDPESFIPLTDIAAEYYNGTSWKPMEFVDGTNGFLNSGSIQFRLDSEHASSKVLGRKAYFIRFRLVGGEFDELPTIRSIKFNLLPVTQRDTLAECFDFPVSNKITILSELSVTGVSDIWFRGSDGLFTAVNSFEKRLDQVTGAVTFKIPGVKDATSIRIANLSVDHLDKLEVGFGTGLPYQEYDLGDTGLEYETFTLMTELPASGGRYVEWKKVRDFSF